MNMALVSFCIHVNPSENIHFGSSLNSYQSHVNGAIVMKNSLARIFQIALKTLLLPILTPPKVAALNGY